MSTLIGVKDFRSTLQSERSKLMVARAKELNCKMSEALANPTKRMEELKKEIDTIDSMDCWVSLTVGEIETILISLKREICLSNPNEDAWIYYAWPTISKKLQDAIK